MTGNPQNPPPVDPRVEAQDAAYWQGVAWIRNLFTVLAAVFLGMGLLLVAWLGPSHGNGGVARDVACAAVALLMVFSIPFLALRRALEPQPWALMHQGQRVVGTVVASHPVGLTLPIFTSSYHGMLQRQCVTLDIQVDGQEATYQVQTCQLVPPSGLGHLKPGARLMAYVDPVEPNRVCIDWQRSA